MADFHEAFWVVAGTGAPVLALAHSLTAARATSLNFSSMVGAFKVISKPIKAPARLIAKTCLSGIFITIFWGVTGVAFAFLICSFYFALKALLTGTDILSAFVLFCLVFASAALPLIALMDSMVTAFQLHIQRQWEKLTVNPGKHEKPDTPNDEDHDKVGT